MQYIAKKIAKALTFLFASLGISILCIVTTDLSDCEPNRIPVPRFFQIRRSNASRIQAGLVAFKYE